MEDIRKEIVKSIIEFLASEKRGCDLDPDQRDAVEVAIQCLENAYVMEGQRSGEDTIKLVEVVRRAIELKKPKVVCDTIAFYTKNLIYSIQVTDEDKEKAEVLKTEGNDAMRAQKFNEAIEKYSK